MDVLVLGNFVLERKSAAANQERSEASVATGLK
jgi:hypothetical protein